jgi:hypothetical protein
MAHEFGHYGLDLRDEYSDSDDNLKCTLKLDIPGSPFTTDSNSSACMMFSQWNAPKLCSSNIANPHRDGTRQGATSCWDHVVARYDSPGQWRLKNGSVRSTPAGVISMAGAPVNRAFMLPTFTFENTGFPGSLPTSNIRVQNPDGSGVLFARVFLIEARPGGRSFDLGLTNGSGDISIEGAHRGDTIIVRSDDGRRSITSSIGASVPATIAFTTPPELEEFVQVKGGGNQPVILPNDGNTEALTLDPNVSLTPNGPRGKLGSSIEVTIPATDLDSVSSITLVPNGNGKVLSANPQFKKDSGGTFSASFSNLKNFTGTVFVRGKAIGGKPAFGLCSFVLQDARTNPEADLFGPYGQIGLSGFPKAAAGASVLIAEVPTWRFGGRDPANFTGYSIESDKPEILNDLNLEYRIPVSRQKKIGKAFAVAITNIKGESMKLLPRPVFHRELGLVTTKLSGAGVYFALQNPISKFKQN